MTTDSNTATGSQALMSNTTGIRNTANGFAALTSNTTGERNTATGRGALAINTRKGLHCSLRRRERDVAQRVPERTPESSGTAEPD